MMRFLLTMKANIIVIINTNNVSVQIQPLSLVEFCHQSVTVTVSCFNFFTSQHKTFLDMQNAFPRWTANEIR